MPEAISIIKGDSVLICKDMDEAQPYIAIHGYVIDGEEKTAPVDEPTPDIPVEEVDSFEEEAPKLKKKTAKKKKG